MSDQAFKIICSHCNGHVEFPPEAQGATVACPHCGQDLFLYGGVHAVETPPVKQGDLSPNPPAATPLLWNPMAAAYWSLLFSPAFGAFLHAKNADNLGRTKEAKTNMVWFYASLVYLGFALTSSFIFPTIPDSIFRYGGLVFYCCWFYVGEKQVKYVKTTWKKNYQKKSWAAPLSIAWGSLIVFIALFVIVSAVIANGSKSAQSEQQTQITQADPQQTEAAAGSASAQSQAQQSDWNRQETDAIKNGNIPFAVRTILANRSLRNQAIIQDPQTVAKTPWNYYGQVVELNGQVGFVQDFPAGSDYGQMLGGQDATDIVASSQDGTIVELFCMKPSGSMKVGDTVNLYGYPAGVTEVPNRLGGKDVHLIVVGNDYDDLGPAQ